MTLFICLHAMWQPLFLKNHNETVAYCKTNNNWCPWQHCFQLILFYFLQECVIPANNVLAHHAFVVFKTESRWKYSLEKNKTCIALQRSKCLNDILHATCGGFADTRYERTGKGSIGKVVHFLWRNNCLGEHYNPLRSNCTQFALRLFKAFSFHQSESLPIFVNDSSDDDPDHYEC